AACLNADRCDREAARVLDQYRSRLGRTPKRSTCRATSTRRFPQNESIFVSLPWLMRAGTLGTVRISRQHIRGYIGIGVGPDEPPSVPDSHAGGNSNSQLPFHLDHSMNACHMDIRTVTVELLRAGPRHNQLVSPLTQYLGVCGNAAAGRVSLPYEHGDLEL